MTLSAHSSRRSHNRAMSRHPSAGRPLARFAGVRTPAPNRLAQPQTEVCTDRSLRCNQQHTQAPLACTEEADSHKQPQAAQQAAPCKANPQQPAQAVGKTSQAHGRKAQQLQATASAQQTQDKTCCDPQEADRSAKQTTDGQTSDNQAARAPSCAQPITGEEANSQHSR